MRIYNPVRTLALVSLLAAAIASPAVLGQSRAPAASPPDGMSSEDILDRLNLSASQRQQIDRIRNSARPRIRALEEQIMSKNEELEAAFQNGTFNQSLATQKLTEMAPIQAQLMGESFKQHNQIMAVLNPQQRRQVEQIEQQERSQFSQPDRGSPSGH